MKGQTLVTNIPQKWKEQYDLQDPTQRIQNAAKPQDIVTYLDILQNQENYKQQASFQCG